MVPVKTPLPLSRAIGHRKTVLTEGRFYCCHGLVPGRQDKAQIITFQTYVCSRRYGYGRGTREAWQFVSVALGRTEYLAVASLAELEYLLMRDDAAEDLVRGARSIWKSYTHWRWRQGALAQRASIAGARANRV